MTQRLTDRFQVGQNIELYFPQHERWLPAVVVKLEHPAIWVRTADEQHWFVTNGRRVREATGDAG